MQENKLNNNVNPNNKKMITIIVILSLLLVGLGGYIVYDKFITKTDNEVKDNKDDNKNEVDKVSELDLFKICSREEQKNICTRTLTLDNKNIELSIIATERTNNENIYYDMSKLQIDGKVVYSDDVNIGKIKAFNDLMILETYCIYCGGASIEIPTIIIIDKNGNIAHDIYTIEYEQDFYYNNKYEITDNTIIVTSKNINVGYIGEYGPYPDFDCHINTTNYNGPRGANGMAIVKDDNYDQFANLIVKSDYEIDYLGNNKFSPARKVKDIKFSDLYSKEHCLAEFKELE